MNRNKNINLNDLRVVKSQNSLKMSLLKLLEEKSIEKITINEICQMAELNRMTFYNHYEDKYHLFNQCLNDIKDEISLKFLTEITLIDFFNNLPSALFKLYEIILDKCIEHKKLIYSIASSQENSLIQFMIKDSLQNSLSKILKDYTAKLNTKINISLFVTFVAFGLCGTTVYYLNHQNECTKQEHLDNINKLLIKILNEAS